MSRLEFRAWDKVNKTYTYVTLGDLICGACTETGDKKLSGNEQIWEQSTGIKDKNGIMIYGGDIVKEVIGKKFAVREVRYCQSVCCFELRYVRGTLDGSSLLNSDNQYKVIGNIHENKDLLEYIEKDQKTE